MIFARFCGFHVQQLLHIFAARSPLNSAGQDVFLVHRQHAVSDAKTSRSGLHPDTQHQCVRAQCGFRFSSASSPTRSLAFGRWGCGERCHLPHVVGDSAVVLSGMSRQIALKRSQKLSDARNGFKCPSGHGRREKRLQRLSGGQARRYP